MKKLKRKAQQRDLVVIGSSAGGLPALIQLVSTLPHDFQAAVLIVQHIPTYATSNLGLILNRVGPLDVKVAEDGELIQAGTIYVATPDHHLLVEPGRILVKRGPKENRFRPSVDALFRSAAYSYGPRVIGVVLSGALDDGTSGLWSIKRLGGITLIQHPQDAQFPDMPINAQQQVEIDYSVPAAEMASLLTGLINQPIGARTKLTKKEQRLLETEILIASRDNAFELGIIEKGELTPFTCPECHGALTQLCEGEIIRFRCHTGHAYTISALLSEVTTNVESILWQAMQSLEEANMLLLKLGQHFDQKSQKGIAHVFFKQAQSMKTRSRIVHDSIVSQQILSGDIGHESRADLKTSPTGQPAKDPLRT